MTYQEIWQTLSVIDCSPHVEKKQGQNFLSWSWAWQTLMDHYPNSIFWFEDDETYPDGTVMVTCTVNIGGCIRAMWLPVMNHKNQAISNPDAFARNTARMRCLVKTLSLFGLFAYGYAGEDLPQSEVDRLYSPITEHQHGELTQMIARLDGDLDMNAFLAFFNVSILSNLKQSDFQKAKMALEHKLMKKEKS